ncbi:MAG: InlB B-repeat-containing protein [Candidatus Ornithomonoglobus sp.]
MRKRKIFRSGISLFVSMVLLIGMLPGLGVRAAGFQPRYSMSSEDCNSIYWRHGNYGSGNGFPRNSSKANGNCTWYAFGRAWELLGSLPKLCTNNAGAWYNYNKNNGYYAYGSTPKLGAIAVWDKYDNNTGHVAVVEEIGSDYVIFSESGWSFTNSYFATAKRRTVNGIPQYYSGYRFLGYIYILNDAAIHVHNWQGMYENNHPHTYYEQCSSCGEKAYPGGSRQVSGCPSCYPLGNVTLTREYNKTGRTAAFYRNNAANANAYSLAVYKDGSVYNTYNMSSQSLSLSNLPSGSYTASITVKNTNTGQSKSASCSEFKIVDSYPVSYNANGGSNAPSSQTKIQDTNLTLSSTVPTRAHYIFKGWASSKTATQAQYQPGSAYTKNTKITLYAVWEPETYTINFDMNGGKGTAESTPITYGNSMKMPNTVVRESYYLKGWAKTKGAAAPDYKLGLDYKLEENMTLYAVWGQSTWGGSVASDFAGGDGTKGNPYQISNAAELAYLADKVNQQTSAPEYAYYVLTDNINLGYEEWVPIGVNDSDYQYFYGELDGNGYTVSDLYISSVNSNKIGLFGCVKDSSIKNISTAGAIENITSTGTIHIGSLAGHTEKTDIEKCNAMYFNVANITGGTSDFSSIGCLIGKADGGDIKNSKAIDCAVNLKGGAYNSGILVGSSSANLTDCDVKSGESGLFSNANTTGKMRIGGLCGYMTGRTMRCTVKAPYLANSINTSSETCIGGLFGYVTDSVKVCSSEFTEGDTKTIDSSSYKTSIFASGQGSNSTGGIAGCAAENADIEDCKYSGQSVAVTTTSGQANVGGLTGKTNAKVTRSFANTDGIVYGSANQTSNVGGVTGTVEMPISIGDYLVMGSYYGAPILWRCVDIDENGPLMLSDRIICIKPFDAAGSNTSGSHNRGYYYNNTKGYYRRQYGSNYWGDSNMRCWLNSDASAGDVAWSCGNPPSKANVENGYNAYADEAGFLSNFTTEEKSIIKSVTQKSLLDGYEYSGTTNTKNSNAHEYNYSISEVVQNYSTAYSENITDKMFLLDVKQINRVYQNDGKLGGNNYYIGIPTSEAVENSEYKSSDLTATGRWYSWLRSPDAYYCNSYLVRFVNLDSYVYNSTANHAELGVRPAFYLNLSTSSGIMGKGTSESPYYVSATEKKGASSAVAVANKISSSTSGSSYYANAGYLAGSMMNGYTFNTSYYDSAMELSAVNTASSSKVTTNNTGTARAERLMKLSSFLTSMLDLKPYTSVADIENDNTAVWVIKDGELPELYYNVLRDISVSEVENGTISVDKPQAVDDELVTVTAEAAEGYELNKIYVNGTEIVGNTFEVSGDSDVYATFAQKTPEYNITVQAAENASAGLVNLDETESMSIAEDGGVTSLAAKDGTEIEVNASANENYTVDAIYVNGEEIASDSFIVEDNSVVTLDVASLSTDVKAMTNDANEIGNFSAVLSGSVDGDEETLKYIRYWEKSNPETIYTTELQLGNGEYKTTVNNLQAETEYEYQMTETGEIKSFTTTNVPDYDPDAPEDAEDMYDNSEAFQQLTSTNFVDDGDSYTFDITFNDSINDAVITVGIYDNSGKLLGSAILQANGEAEYYTVVNKNEAAAYAKIFVWEDMKNARPLSKTEYIEIIQ